MTPTSKEGPPTLREWEAFLEQVVTGDLKYEVVDDEVTGIPDYIKAEAPISLKKQADELLARLTDEALERDEKRRAALEKVTETAIQVRDHLVAFINCLCEKDHKLFSKICRDPRISEYAGSAGQFGTALAELDALTPAPKESVPKKEQS